MKLFYILFFVLIFLLSIILIAAVSPEVIGATGAPHPEFEGMLISPANIDQEPHTKWLGYLFGFGVITLFGVMLFIGNRKKEKITSIGKWIGLGLIVYLIVYTGLVVSHWSYVKNDGGDFFMFMPIPTAWMIFGAWFVPLIITLAYTLKFEEAVISDQEIKEFHDFLASQEEIVA